MFGSINDPDFLRFLLSVQDTTLRQHGRSSNSSLVEKSETADKNLVQNLDKLRQLLDSYITLPLNRDVSRQTETDSILWHQITRYKRLLQCLFTSFKRRSAGEYRVFKLYRTW